MPRPVRLKTQVLHDEDLESGSLCLEWHVWQRRLAPYHDLAPGDHVVMVQGDIDTGILSWEVEVVDVVSARCAGVDEAWNLVRPLAAAAGVDEDMFRDDPYSQRLDDGEHYVLGWTYAPVRYIGRPRVRGVHDLPRTGWAQLPRLTVGGPGPSGAAGQGRADDAGLRRETELAAMARARRALLDEGWHEDDIRDTSQGHPYDFEVGPEHRPALRVEVKGTLGGPGDVIVTRNEVDSALTGGITTDLMIVHSLVATLDGDGTWRVTDGVLWREQGWRPRPDQLTAVQFRYRPDYDA
ncbi:protein NO VEIN domain-containing protein [Dactylosporangium sp. CA-139114]|uniref:protein NO VEIN domain-containing protein n=1 Tax=Dactylosporangium sp. CA-139114 TaxID=3239931 RepID=UPI003D98F5DE